MAPAGIADRHRTMRQRNGRAIAQRPSADGDENPPKARFRQIADHRGQQGIPLLLEVLLKWKSSPHSVFLARGYAP